MPVIADPAVQALAEIARRTIRGMEDHPVAKKVQAEVMRLHSGADALHQVAKNRSPLDTEAAHAVKVAKVSERYQKELTAAVNRVAAICRNGRADVEARIAKKVDLTPNAFAQEIRAAFRTMSPKAKAEQVNQLIAENRGPELAALVKAPAILTGLSAAQQQAYEKAVLSRHAAAELEEMGQLDELLSAHIAADHTACRFAQGITDPSKLAVIQRQAAEADAAVASADAAMSAPSE